MKLRESAGQNRAALLAVLSAVVFGFWIAGARGQQTPGAGPFTEAQGDAGQMAYAGNCASCHANSLAGTGEAPALAGTGFIASWSRRTTQELYNEIRLAMPPDSPNSLSPETYVAITAFLLKANGAQSGTSPLAPETTVTIGSIATGQ